MFEDNSIEFEFVTLQANLDNKAYEMAMGNAKVILQHETQFVLSEIADRNARRPGLLARLGIGHLKKARKVRQEARERMQKLFSCPYSIMDVHDLTLQLQSLLAATSAGEAAWFGIAYIGSLTNRLIRAMRDDVEDPHGDADAWRIYWWKFTSKLASKTLTCSVDAILPTVAVQDLDAMRKWGNATIEKSKQTFFEVEVAKAVFTQHQQLKVIHSAPTQPAQRVIKPLSQRRPPALEL